MFEADEDRYQNQIEIYEGQLEILQEKLEEMEGIDTPEINQHREELANTMHDIQLSIENTQQQYEQLKEQEENQQDLGYMHD